MVTARGAIASASLLLFVGTLFASAPEIHWRVAGATAIAVEPNGRTQSVVEFAAPESAIEGTSRGMLRLSNGFALDSCGGVLWRERAGSNPWAAPVVALRTAAWDPPYAITPVPDPNWYDQHIPPQFDTAGNAWVLVTHGLSGGGAYNLQVRRSNGHDGTWGPLTTIYSQPFGPPEFTIDKQNAMTVVFRTISGGQYVLNYMRYLPDTGWTAPQSLFQTSNYFQAIELAADAAGHVVAIIDENVGATRMCRSFCFDPTTNLWTDLGRISPADCNLLMPTVLRNRGGDTVVLVYLVRSGCAVGLYAHRWDGTSLTWTNSEFIPGTELAGFQGAGPTTHLLGVVDVAGDATLIWENAYPGPYAPHASRCIAGIWQSPVPLLPLAANPACVEEFSGASVNATGDVFTASTRFVSGYTRLYASFFDHTTGTWRPAENPYNPNLNFQTRARIALYQHRRAVCTAFGVQDSVVQLVSLRFDGTAWLAGLLDIPGDEDCFFQDFATDRGEALLVFEPEAGVLGPSYGIRGSFLRDLYPGDLNCDGVVSFDDINPFVLALSDAVGYSTEYADCNILNGDINGDTVVNFDDINAFVALLSGG